MLSKKSKKRKKGTRGWVIPFVILSIFSFTATAVWVQLVIQIELSSTLITCFYAFCTGELWMLASIKKSKLNNGQKSRAYDVEIENYKHENNVVMSDDEEGPVG